MSFISFTYLNLFFKCKCCVVVELINCLIRKRSNLVVFSLILIIHERKRDVKGSTLQMVYSEWFGFYYRSLINVLKHTLKGLSEVLVQKYPNHFLTLYYKICIQGPVVSNSSQVAYFRILFALMR